MSTPAIKSATRLAIAPSSPLPRAKNANATRHLPKAKKNMFASSLKINSLFMLTLLGEIRNARETTSSRNYGEQEDAEVGLDRATSICGSQLPHMACSEKLCPSLRQVSAHHDEIAPQ
jgi:hypothetical protein